MKLKQSWLFLFALIPVSCGEQLPAATDVSSTVAQSSKVCEQTTWTNFGAQFFATNCASCHAYTSNYNEVVKRAAEVKAEIESGDMPKGSKLDEATKTKVLSFIACGLPKGKGASTAAPQSTPVDTKDDDGDEKEEEEETPDGTALYCASCTSDDDCAGSAMCLYAADGKSAICGKPCKTSDDCREDSECYDIEDSDGTKLGRSCYPGGGLCSGTQGTTGPTGVTGTTGATGTTGTTGPVQCTTQTWATVSPTMTTYCAGCHSWAKTYTGTKAKGSKVGTRVSSGSMPPANKPQPSSSEENNLVEWVNCGLPEN
jgi:hypothetical protein